MTRLNSWVRFLVLAAGLAWALTGCGWWPLQTFPTSSNQGQDSSAASTASLGQVLSGTSDPPPAADQVSEAEPNDDFATAQPVSFTETVYISGAIHAGAVPYDRDVFDLGPVSPNDRILADLQTDPGADVELGIFDEAQRLLGYIDMTSSTSGPGEADFILREASEQLHVVLATRTDSGKHRPYVARLSVQRGVGRVTLRPQVLVLNFLGAQGVRIGSRAPVDVPPFDASRINPDYAGQTQTVISLVLAKVQAAYAGLSVFVYAAGDPAIPAGDHSTIYFGTYDSRLLGLADNVDPYNSHSVQSAILYTDTFAVFNALSPSVEQMSQVLANTTSHEAGHLLGLRHTADPTDLMDTTATARQMMLPQTFELADLNASVLPVGQQDAPTMLAWTVGGELLRPTTSKLILRQRAIQAAAQPGDFYVPREWLMDCPCTGCDQH